MLSSGLIVLLTLILVLGLLFRVEYYKVGLG